MKAIRVNTLKFVECDLISENSTVLMATTGQNILIWKTVQTFVLLVQKVDGKKVVGGVKLLCGTTIDADIVILTLGPWTSKVLTFIYCLTLQDGVIHLW